MEHGTGVLMHGGTAANFRHLDALRWWGIARATTWQSADLLRPEDLVGVGLCLELHACQLPYRAHESVQRLGILHGAIVAVAHEGTIQAVESILDGLRFNQ